MKFYVEKVKRGILWPTFIPAKIQLLRIFITRALRIYKFKPPWRAWLKQNLRPVVVHWRFSLRFLSCVMFTAYRDANQKTFVSSRNSGLIMSSLTMIMARAVVNSQGTLSQRTIEAHTFSVKKESRQIRNVTHFQAAKVSRKTYQLRWRSCILFGVTKRNRQTTSAFFSPYLHTKTHVFWEVLDFRSSIFPEDSDISD